MTSTISSPLSAEPGETVTIPFKIFNPNAKTIELHEEPVLPPGWSLVLKPATLIISPNQSEICLLSFQVPLHCLAGDYNIYYRINYFIKKSFHTTSISNPNNLKYLSENIFKLKVLPTYQIDIIPDSQTLSPYILAGEEYTPRFNIVNHGNTSQQISLTATTPEGFPISISQKLFSLLPGENKGIELKIKTPDDIANTQEYRFTLTATMKDKNKEEHQFNHYGKIRLIPHISGNPDAYHRIPSRLSLKYQKDGQMDIDIQGNGLLKDTGNSKLNYLFHLEPLSFLDVTSPNEIDYSMCFTTEDNHMVSLCLGESDINLSPLLNNELFNHGIKGHWDNNTYHLTACYSNLVHNEKDAQEFVEKGYTISLGGEPFDHGWDIDLSYQNTTLIAGNPALLPGNSFRIEDNPDTPITEILSLGIKKKDLFDHLCSPNKNLFLKANLDLEYARSSNGQQNQSAFIGRINGQFKSINFSFSEFYAEPDYPGELNGNNFQNFALSRKLGENISLGWQYQKQEKISSDELKKSNHFNLQYQSANNRVFLLYQNLLEEDASNQQIYNLYQLYFSHQREKINLQSYYQLKYTDTQQNNLQEEENKFYLSADYHPNPQHSYHLSYFSEMNHPRHSMDKRELQFSTQYALNDHHSLSGSCSFHNQPFSTENIDLNLSYQHAFTNGFNLELGQLYAFHQKEIAIPSNDYEVSISPYIGATYRHEFANDSTLSFKGQYSFSPKSFSEGIDLFEIAYEAPFGLPLRHKKDRGVIKGKIHQIEDLQSPGVKGVLVKCNHFTTITNDQGDFIFQGLKSGEYILQVGQSTLPENYITAIKMPKRLILEKGEKQIIDIGICRKALLQGNVIQYDFPSESFSSQNSPVKKGGIHHLCLYLKNMDTGEVSRSVTGREGHFFFQDLRPGVWELSINHLQLPAFHTIEDYPHRFNLEPGEIRQIKINILPYKRKIKMIENISEILKLSNQDIDKINLK